MVFLLMRCSSLRTRDIALVNILEILLKHPVSVPHWPPLLPHQEEQGSIARVRTRGVPEVDDKSRDDNRERRKVEPVWRKVLFDRVRKSQRCVSVSRRTKRKSPVT